MAKQTVSLGSAGAITIVYDADEKPFEKKTKGVEGRISGLDKEIANNAKTFAKWAAGAVLAAGTVAAAMFSSQSKVMDQLRRTSDAMGEQQERLQALIHLAGLADVEASTLTTSLDFMVRALGGITKEGDPANKMIERLGLNITDLRALTPSQQLEEIARGLTRIEDTGERADIRTQLLGRGSKELTDLLRDLATQGIAPTIQKLDEMGILLTRVQTQAVDNAGNAVFEAGQVLSGIAQQAVAAMAPFVQVLAEAFVDSVDDVDNWGERVTTVLDQVAVGGIMVAARIRGPLDTLKSALQDIWSGYQTLPAWAQEIGIVGAILGGRAGVAVFAGLSFGTEKVKDMARWVAAFNQALESSPVTASLQSILQKTQEIAQTIDSTEWEAEGPSLIEKLFGGSEEQQQSAEEWADDAIAAYRAAIARVREQAAQGAAAAEANITPPGGGEESPEFAHTKEENERLLETIRERFMSQREIEEANYEEEQARLYELLQQKTDYWEDYYTVQEQLAAEHEKKMREIAEAERAAKLSIFSNMFTNLSSLMNTGSRKLFAIGKAAAIANALIKGREAVVSSYAAGAKIGGPWLGAAYAATAAIATASQIAQIRSASFDGGGSSGGSTSYSGGIPVTNTAPASSAGPVQPSRQTSITLVGGNFTAQQVRDLIGQINEQLGDGMQLIAN